MSDTNPAPITGGVTPYLMVAGAADAIAFYKRAFGATEVGERAADDADTVMNARVDINGAPVMLMDPMPQHGYPDEGHKGYNLHLQVDDVDRWHERAAAAGADTVMAPHDAFWGDRYAMIRDPFGVTWGLGAPLSR